MVDLHRGGEGIMWWIYIGVERELCGGSTWGLGLQWELCSGST